MNTPALSPDAPNVLVIMADQLKATASHLYGNTFCETPSLERLAREGVRYQHAFVPQPLCAPSRTSLWTAQYPHTHGARRNQTLMPPGADHAFKCWHQAGYQTGLIGKNHCFAHPHDLERFDVWCEIGHEGLPKRATRGMAWVRPVEAVNRAHEVRRRMPRQHAAISYAATDLPLEDFSTGLIAAQTIRFLEENRTPFALWVSFPDPHEPYAAPQRYTDMFPPSAIDLPPWRDDELKNAPERTRVLYQMLGIDDAPTQHIYGVLAAYYGMVRFLDDGLGQILDALERLHLREKTIVVFCSDHGDFAGEHRMMVKGGAFYDCLTRVPLLVSWPTRLLEGQVDDSMVSLTDVVPTLLNLQGYDVPTSMQGKPLPILTTALPREAAFSEYGAGGPPFTQKDLEALPVPYGHDALYATLRWREAEGRRKMVRTREWKYVHDPTGDVDELYDLRSDPWELVNVVGELANKDVVCGLQKRLLQWSVTTEDAVSVPLPEAAR